MRLSIPLFSKTSGGGLISYYYQMLAPDSPYSELLAPYFQPESSDLQSWMESPYEQNKKYPEQKIYGTSAGIHVRSKSESMIVYLLHDYKIPFRYESELELGQVTVYPDFTIRHPSLIPSRVLSISRSGILHKRSKS